jgi:hypothetical protein
MMLMIQGQTNDNYLTLSERLTVASGYFILVRFISEDTLVDTTTIASVVSGTTAYRYHKLTISERDNATDIQRQGGSVSLNPYGMFLYEVYQQLSSTNLDYTLAGTLLEVGKCLTTKSSGFDSLAEYTGATP